MYLKYRVGTEYSSKSVLSRNLALFLCLSSFCAGMFFTNRYFFGGFLRLFEFGTFSFTCAAVWLRRKCVEREKEIKFFLHWVVPHLKPAIEPFGLTELSCIIWLNGEHKFSKNYIGLPFFPSFLRNQTDGSHSCGEVLVCCNVFFPHVCEIAFFQEKVIHSLLRKYPFHPVINCC